MSLTPSRLRRNVLVLVAALTLPYLLTSAGFAQNGIQFSNFSPAKKRYFLLGTSNAYHFMNIPNGYDSDCADGYAQDLGDNKTSPLFAAVNSFADEHPFGNVEPFIMDYFASHCDKRQSFLFFDNAFLQDSNLPSSDVQTEFLLGIRNTIVTLIVRYGNERSGRCAVDLLDEKGYNKLVQMFNGSTSANTYIAKRTIENIQQICGL